MNISKQSKKSKQRRGGRTTLCVLIVIIIIMIIGIVIFSQRIFNTANDTDSPIFYTDSSELIEPQKEFSLSDYYITNKVTGLNKYYIDSESNLWGYGTNKYGQLGNGQWSDLDVYIRTPYKIASNVVSVDCSVNGYFCIYLTANGELYGIGLNMLGLLGQDYDQTNYYSIYDNRVTHPVLLMEQVSFARAGRESIVALKNDGSVWWWGQYMSTYQTNISDINNHAKTVEDENNPCKMLKTAPCKMLDNCIYATTGDWTGAAISENGDLYTWGLNIFGECGVTVSNDDYVRTPCKVLENVQMVWPEKIEINSKLEEIPEQTSSMTVYYFNTFVQLKDGSLLGAGRWLGDMDKVISITGDRKAETAYSYSDTFVPIKLKEYSDEEIQDLISQLEPGTSKESVEQFLIDHGIQFIYSLNYDESTMQYMVNPNELRDQDQKYFFYFDSDNNLTDIVSY